MAGLDDGLDGQARSSHESYVVLFLFTGGSGGSFVPAFEAWLTTNSHFHFFYILSQVIEVSSVFLVSTVRERYTIGKEEYGKSWPGLVLLLSPLDMKLWFLRDGNAPNS
ncbi:hypothetical protein CCHR01_00598 [Colletotrichum chrysophilum]|uniref:Uncharacterized protein n=1 Tax=Colletotrichum chrysophilum TaxID=1836956 RepID=A0AAD9B3P2_9PEZI|nr:hypothetical protein CCHR01_00598 [Colletotrichum chrysophilum]